MIFQKRGQTSSRLLTFTAAAPVVGINVAFSIVTNFYDIILFIFFFSFLLLLVEVYTRTSSRLHVHCTIAVSARLTTRRDHPLGV